MPNNPIEWQNNTPVSTLFDDVYYSTDNGLAESRYVFLENSNLPTAWRDKQQFTILETGFGTGLNFCATSLLWQQEHRAEQQLHFVSIEKHPLQQHQIKQALAQWPELNAISTELCRLLPPAIPGWHMLSFPQWNLKLTLIYDDVSKALDAINTNDLYTNAIFLDGFSPSKNPDMWTDKVLHKLAICAAEGASLATFTAAGRIRRTLSKVGFNMSKASGFGVKREMLVGTYYSQRSLPKVAWHKLDAKPPPKTVAIIGAGIAGCIMAYKLAERGIKVKVYEQSQHIASGASGNPQAVLFIKLSAADGILASFSRAAFLYAERFYQQLLLQNVASSAIINLHGMLQLLDPDDWQKLKSQHEQYPELVRFINAEEASVIAGTKVAKAAAFFPNSGCIDPQQLCATLLQHQNITLHSGVKIEGLTTHADYCELITANKNIQADTVIVASANDSQNLVQAMKLPIKAAPGQITQFTAMPEHYQLNCTVCHEGYLAPPHNDAVCIGATFRMNTKNTDISETDNLLNLSRYRAACPELPIPKSYEARVSSRTASADYLPLAGAVPNVAEFNKVFGAISRNGKTHIASNGCHTPNLFIMTGLGSRGLSYAPIAAELICQQLLGEAILLEPSLAQALNPSRFVMRAIKRGTVDALL